MTTRTFTIGCNSVVETEKDTEGKQRGAVMFTGIEDELNKTNIELNFAHATSDIYSLFQVGKKYKCEISISEII